MLNQDSQPRGFLQRHLQKIIIFSLLVILFLVIRSTNLTLFPPYVDEWLHINRAFNILKEGQLLVYTEGGKYLQIWLITPVIALSSDPIWSTRMVSVVAGLLAAIGCYFLGKTLFQRAEVGLAAAFFYTVIPYAFFLDRLVLNDGMLGALGIYIFLFSVMLIKKPGIWPVVGLGLSLGLAGLTKLNGFALWGIPALVTLAHQLWPIKVWRYIAKAYLLGIVVALPVIFLLPQQISAPADKTWILDGSSPTSFYELWFKNFQRGWVYFQTYLTWPILIIIFLGVILILWQRHRNGLALIGITFIYIIFFNVIGTEVHPRYLYPVIPFLLIPAGYAVITISDWLVQLLKGLALPLRDTVLSGIIQITLVILLALPAMRFDVHLLFDPLQAPLEPVNRWLFIDGWLSGYGLDEASAYFKEQATQRGPIVVVRHDTPGLTREGLDLTLGHEADIKLVTINLFHDSANQLTHLLKKEARPVYVILSLPPVMGTAPYTVNFQDTPYCREAIKFFKPDNFNFLGVFECGTHFFSQVEEKSP